MSFFKREMIGEDKDTQDRINKLERLVAFLSRYNRDEVVLKEDYCFPGGCGYISLVALYIANDKVIEVMLGCHHINEKVEVIYNKKHIAIVRKGEAHLMIDKIQRTVTDISEFYVDVTEKKTEEEENK